MMTEAANRPISKGRRFHAYLFTGGAPGGRLESAKQAVKELLCENQGTKPCGACFSCETIKSGNHPDVHYIKPDKKTTISAEYIREAVVAKSYTKPYHSSFQIFVIENADMLNITGQNILLKTLEEPPPGNVIILLAENEGALLPTVLSRLVKVRGEISVDIMPQKHKNTIDSILNNLRGDSPAEVLLKVKTLEEFKDDAAVVLDYLLSRARDLAAAWQIEDAREKLSRNVGFLIVMESLFLKLKGIKNG